MFLEKFVLVCIASIFGCATNTQDSTTSRLMTWQQVVRRVESEVKTPEYFANRGPVPFTETQDFKIPASRLAQVPVDFYIPQLGDGSPIVLMVHGNKFNKLVHRDQCRHLASWGFHCLAIEVPNEGQWLENGKIIERIAQIIHTFPDMLSERILADKIILAGHSFGGSAVTLAAGHRAPVAGLILLDPAVVHPKVKEYMGHVDIPAILLGADTNVFASRKRRLFFKHIAGPMSEVSVSGATHNDAQLPSIATVEWGFDFQTSEKNQAVFLQAITTSAFSIGAFSNVDFAWKAFNPYLKVGVLKGGKIKPAKKKSGLATR